MNEKEEFENLSEKKISEMTEDEVKRFNELKEKKLQGRIDGYKGERAAEDVSQLKKLVDGAEQELVTTVEIAGNELEVLVDPDETDMSRLSEIKKKYGGKESDELSEEEVRDMKDALFDVLGKFSVDYSESDWREAFEGKGLTTLVSVATKVFGVVQEEVDKQKKTL